MKKVLSLIFALAMMFCLSATAFAAEGSQTVTTTVPEAGYVLTVPAATEIPYGTTEAFDLGECTISVPNGGISIDVTVTGDCFSSATPGVITTIPYVLSRYDDEIAKAEYHFGSDMGFDTFHMYMFVAQEAWEAAQPGAYTTTVTYSASLHSDLPSANS